MIDNWNDETNFLHKSLLTGRQVANLCEAFAKNLSANIKLSKSHLSTIIESGGFFGRRFGPLIKADLPLMRNVFTTSAKSVLIPLRLKVAASTIGSRIHKKRFWIRTTTLIILIEEIEDILIIVKALANSA